MLTVDIFLYYSKENRKAYYYEKRITITHYNSEEELELIKKFKEDLKKFQVKESNTISISYTTKEELAFLRAMKEYLALIKNDKPLLQKCTQQFLNATRNKVNKPMCVFCECNRCQYNSITKNLFPLSP